MARLKSAWDKLSMRDRALFIRLGVLNGIYDIRAIKGVYNEYHDEDSKENYDYNMAAAIATGFGPNQNKHWPDTFKKSNHPTFSVESIYSTKETPGGTWGPNFKTFEPSDWMINTYGSTPTIEYLLKHDPEVTPVYMGGVLLPEITVTANRFNNGGTLAHKYDGEEYGNENYVDTKPGDTTTEINDNITLAQLAVDYIHSYYNSDGFKARRKQYNWQRGEPRRIRRRMDRTTIPINYIPDRGYNSLYDFRNNQINVGLNPKPSMAGLELYTIPVAETAAHEVTHAYDYPKTNIYGEPTTYDDSYKERGYYSSLPSELYNKYFTNLPEWTDSYRRQSDELYADLGGLRAIIYLTTGYDSRLVDDKGNPIPISDELWNAFKQTDYYKNNRFIKTHGDERSRLALLEIAQNNSSSSFLRLDGTYLAALGGLLDNKKSTGGPLYPFSFEKNPFLKTPAVRYDEGGHLFGFGDWLTNLFSPTATTHPVSKEPAPLDLGELATRQAYAESRFDSNAVSPANAIGLFLVTPNTLSYYNSKTGNTFTTQDLYDDTINQLVRDWYMNDLMNRPWNTKNNPSDSVQYAKSLGAYNWGPTNLVDTLNKAKADGVDIYNSWDWLTYLPAETRDYINFVLRNLNNSAHRNNMMYNRTTDKYLSKVSAIKSNK